MKNLLLLLLILIGSCMYPDQVTKVSAEPRPKTTLCVDPGPWPGTNKQLYASIGGQMLSHQLEIVSAEKVVAAAPPGLRELPLTNKWRITHAYPGGGKGGVVYTHPDYFNGDVGAVVNDDGIVTQWVQVWGAKKGRLWEGSNTPFFGRTRQIRDRWLLNYVGRQGTDYRFEIVDRPNDKARTITRDFVLSEEEFLGHFPVRGVGIRGLESGEYNKISYIITRVPPVLNKCPPELRRRS